MASTPRSLPWPDTAPVLPVEPLRPVIEGLESLALRHPEDVHLYAPLVDEEGEADASADPPPALVQVLEELGGADVRGRAVLDLLIDERSDLGPYTLLGAPTTFYPLHEGEDVAIILAIGADGAPGAVYGIGEDLSLTLAARDLGGFLERYAEALRLTMEELEPEIRRTRGEDALTDEDARTEVAAQLMDSHLLRTVLGDLPAAERTEVPILPLAHAQLDAGVRAELPAGTVGIADLREAALDATVPVMDAELPGELEALHVGWAADGLIVCLIEGEAA